MLTLLLASLLSAAAPQKSVPSPDSLVAVIIEALNARDVSRLGALSPDKEEFLQVYPFFETDTSRTRREFTTSYFLLDNQKILQRRVDEEGGRNVVLSRYDVEGPLATYGPMVLYRGFRLWVRDGEGEREVRLVKSAARLNGGWKIWSFRDN